MFDVGFTELLLLFVIGLLILGPDRLPRVAAQLGRWVARARRTANQLRIQLEREVALDDIKRSQQRRNSPKKPETPSGEAGDDTAAGAAGGTAQAPGTAGGGPGGTGADASHGGSAEPAASAGDHPQGQAAENTGGGSAAPAPPAADATAEESTTAR